MSRARALVTALLVCASASAVIAQDGVFRASVDAVSLGVAVTRAGRPVSDLQPTEFHVTDNGVAQTITALTYEKLPIDLTVLLDVSGSVSGAVLDQLRVAIGDLQRNLRAQDRLKIVTFNMRARRIFERRSSLGITTENFVARLLAGFFDQPILALVVGSLQGSVAFGVYGIGCFTLAQIGLRIVLGVAPA